MRHCRTGKITPERGLWREVVFCDRIIVRRNRFLLNAILMIDFFSSFKRFLNKSRKPSPVSVIRKFVNRKSGQGEDKTGTRFSR